MTKLLTPEQELTRALNKFGVSASPSTGIYAVAVPQVNILREQKLSAGITKGGKAWDCSRYSTGGIAAKYERLKRQGAGTAKTITGATQANPVVVTAVANGFLNNDDVEHAGVLGMVELVGIFTVGNVAANTYELTGIDGTAWGAYTSGGTATELCEWIANDNTIGQFSVADFLSLCDDMNNYLELVVKQARVHKNAILALTVQADVDAYDITVGWPSNIY